MQLVERASANDYRAICLFMQSMDVLPRMPHFDLYGDPSAQRDLRQHLKDSGVGLDVAYPFTLTRHTSLDDFQPGLDCAAALRAQFVNVLIYDRDEARRMDNFTAFCDRASKMGLRVVLEFFPNSAVRTLAESIAIVRAVQRAGLVGVNVDLLHLMRSGGSIEELAATSSDDIFYAQFCDGMIARDPATWGYEASSQRLLPGEGQFDLAGFALALPKDCLTSLEIPQEDAIVGGVTADERARTAMMRIRNTVRDA